MVTRNPTPPEEENCGPMSNSTQTCVQDSSSHHNSSVENSSEKNSTLPPNMKSLDARIVLNYSYPSVDNLKILTRNKYTKPPEEQTLSIGANQNLTEPGVWAWVPSWRGYSSVEHLRQLKKETNPPANMKCLTAGKATSDFTHTDQSKGHITDNGLGNYNYPSIEHLTKITGDRNQSSQDMQSLTASTAKTELTLRKDSEGLTEIQICEPSSQSTDCNGRRDHDFSDKYSLDAGSAKNDLTRRHGNDDASSDCAQTVKSSPLSLNTKDADSQTPHDVDTKSSIVDQSSSSPSLQDKTESHSSSFEDNTQSSTGSKNDDRHLPTGTAKNDLTRSSGETSSNCDQTGNSSSCTAVTLDAKSPIVEKVDCKPSLVDQLSGQPSLQQETESNASLFEDYTKAGVNRPIRISIKKNERRLPTGTAKKDLTQRSGYEETSSYCAQTGNSSSLTAVTLDADSPIPDEADGASSSEDQLNTKQLLHTMNDSYSSLFEDYAQADMKHSTRISIRKEEGLPFKKLVDLDHPERKQARQNVIFFGPVLDLPALHYLSSNFLRCQAVKEIRTLLENVTLEKSRLIVRAQLPLFAYMLSHIMTTETWFLITSCVILNHLWDLPEIKQMVNDPEHQILESLVHRFNHETDFPALEITSTLIMRLVESDENLHKLFGLIERNKFISCMNTHCAQLQDNCIKLFLRAIQTGYLVWLVDAENIAFRPLFKYLGHKDLEISLSSFRAIEQMINYRYRELTNVSEAFLADYGMLMVLKIIKSKRLKHLLEDFMRFVDIVLTVERMEYLKYNPVLRHQLQALFKLSPQLEGRPLAHLVNIKCKLAKIQRSFGTKMINEGYIELLCSYLDCEDDLLNQVGCTGLAVFIEDNYLDVESHRKLLYLNPIQNLLRIFEDTDKTWEVRTAAYYTVQIMYFDIPKAKESFLERLEPLLLGIITRNEVIPVKTICSVFDHLNILLKDVDRRQIVLTRTTMEFLLYCFKAMRREEKTLQRLTKLILALLPIQECLDWYLNSRGNVTYVCDLIKARPPMRLLQLDLFALILFISNRCQSYGLAVIERGLLNWWYKQRSYKWAEGTVVGTCIETLLNLSLPHKLGYLGLLQDKDVVDTGFYATTELIKHGHNFPKLSDYARKSSSKPSQMIYSVNFDGWPADWLSPRDECLMEGEWGGEERSEQAGNRIEERISEETQLELEPRSIQVLENLNSRINFKYRAAFPTWEMLVPTGDGNWIRKKFPLNTDDNPLPCSASESSQESEQAVFDMDPGLLHMLKSITNLIDDALGRWRLPWGSGTEIWPRRYSSIFQSLEEANDDAFFLEEFEKSIIKLIAQVICNRVTLDTSPNGESMDAYLKELQADLRSSIIPIGRLTMGREYERALLFKIIADKLDLKCGFYRLEHRAAVEVQLLYNLAPSDSSRFWVDLDRNPGHVTPHKQK